MFDSVTEIETALLYIISGSVLFVSSSMVFLIFICYKELRNGVYGLILGTTVCEVYFGIHSVINGIYGLTRTNNWKINMVYCQTEAMISVFFFNFWCFQNILTILLLVKRKLKRIKLTNLLTILSLLFSAIISIVMYLDNTLGESISDTCFISNVANFSTLIIIILVSLLFIFSVIFNIWFYFIRDTARDRSFINGYNCFIFFTSFLFMFVILHMVLISFFNLNSKAIYYIALSFTHMAYLYISYFRLQIEYVRIFLSQGPSASKIVNCFFFVFTCCSSKPKFKNIKRKLNVKYIETGNINDTDDTIFSQIMKTSDI